MEYNGKKIGYYPGKERNKNRSMVYDYSTVRHIGQVMRVCGHDVGFTDVRMLVASRRNKWLENLVKEFGNDVGAKGGMIR